jgi:tRNA A-37 threonylcarbamoyl transferase component Bud32
VADDARSQPKAEDEAENDDAAFDALLRAVAEAPRLPKNLLATVTFEPTAGMTPVSLPLASSLPRTGDVVDDRYLIQGELGRGGMGVVFSGKNLRTQREVALKWLLPRSLMRREADQRESVERFVREARAVSRVDHPNVVRVLDVGGDPDMPYLVMERLLGETLRARLVRGPLGWDEALGLLLPAMQGVSAAHRVGVVHRDLKPDNIFLCEGGAKVLDFGVSRIGGDGDHTTLTRTGTMLGTPAYMPLEQLRGRRDVDERTDVYALGVILFEALSGRLPFESQTPADQAVLLATQAPVNLAELRPEFAPARAEAVMKALAREPRDRYPSVDAMQAALLRANVQLASRRSVYVALALAGLVLVVLAVMSTRSSSGAIAPTPSALAPKAQEHVTKPRAAPAPAPVVPAQVEPELVAPEPPAPAALAPRKGPEKPRAARPESPRVEDSKEPRGAAPAATRLSEDDFHAGEADKPAQPSPSAETPRKAKPVLDRADF